MAFNPAARRSANSNTKESRMAQAAKFRREGDQLFKRGLLINAEEEYSKATDLLEVAGMKRSKSGDDDENRLLAQCFSNRAICILNMAEGKGVIDDGTPFIQQFTQDKAFLRQFRRQALEQAEQAANYACDIHADAKSLFRLGLARMYLAKTEEMGQPRLAQERVDQMKDAAQCLAKSMIKMYTECAEARLEEARSWLYSYGVQNMYPDYI